MKIPIILFFNLLSCLLGFSQTLEGRWEGYFEQDLRPFASPDLSNTQNSRIKMALEFIKRSDSSYTISSFTEIYNYPPNRKYTAVCAMIGFIKADSVFLRETYQISPIDYNATGFQTMYLILTEKRKGFVLKGIWEANSGGSGRIYFYKKKKKIAVYKI